MAFSRSLAMIVAATALSSGAIGQQAAPVAPDAAALAHPDLWPKLPLKRQRDPKVEARVEQILSRMSIEDKVGQLIQVDIASITPKDLETYKLGSILNGGNSAPNNDEFAPAPEWLRLFDEAQRRSPAGAVDLGHGRGARREQYRRRDAVPA